MELLNLNFNTNGETQFMVSALDQQSNYSLNDTIFYDGYVNMSAVESEGFIEEIDRASQSPYLLNIRPQNFTQRTQVWNDGSSIWSMNPQFEVSRNEEGQWSTDYSGINSLSESNGMVSMTFETELMGDYRFGVQSSATTGEEIPSYIRPRWNFSYGQYFLHMNTNYKVVGMQGFSRMEFLLGSHTLSMPMISVRTSFYLIP